MDKFNHYKKLFDANRMDEVTESAEGLLWIKVKSITRKQLIDNYCQSNYPHIAGKTLKEKSICLYTELLTDINQSHTDLDRYMRSIAPARAPRDLEKIASELHKMQHFSWGGDYSNALDRFLVDRYIKTYDSYETIQRMLETEIPQAVSGYVNCSWYNHWSTILIENLFRQHDKVLPAIGNIKKVDFFIDNIPFDLKVTYLPANYVKHKRKQAGMKDELSELKFVARKNNICFDRTAKPKNITYEITERIKASGSHECKEIVEEQRRFRQNLVNDCAKNPKELLQNLYEEQGEMRFDASNRLFMILADTQKFENSWKLKRNPDLLQGHINAYLNNFSASVVKKRKITFTHKARSGEFTAVADAIFVII